ATVAIENISHHLEAGTEKREAILLASAQIAVPTLVSTLSICIVFIPMFLLSGVARYLFVPLGEAVVFAMLASYFFSRTLIPTLAMYLLKSAEQASADAAKPLGPLMRFQRRFERGFEKFRDFYRGRLESGLARPRALAIGFLGVCLGTAMLVPFLGQDFFPTSDTGEIRLHLRAKTGTRIEEAARITDNVETRIRSLIPKAELGSILDNISLPVSGINLTYDSASPIGNADADVLVTLNAKHRPTAQYVQTLRTALNTDFPGVSFGFLPADIISQILNFGLPSPIDIQIVGGDVNGNRAAATKLVARLRQVQGLVDVRIQQPDDAPAINIDVDRTEAMKAGFQQRQIGQNLLIALSGSSQTSPNFWLNPKNGVSYPLMTMTPQYTVDSLDALRNIPLAGASPNAGGGAASAAGAGAAAGASPGVPGAAKSQILGSLGTLDRGSQEAVISHYNVQPVIDIFGSVQGRDLGGVAREITGFVDQARGSLPAGSSIVVRGQVQTMQSSFTGLLTGLGFAVLLVYLLMVINFQSWIDPLIIISGLPAALVGIVWMLFVTGTTVSVPALTGTIMCIGIATANSILVVSFARESLEQGTEPLRAALDAGLGRFRPVLMTALAMVIGMLPMALGLGDGGEQNAPLGRAVIGGLLFGTMSTLLFVPAVFSAVHGWLKRREAHTASTPALSAN
ncbi:MAG TPA: efflux RND transporter permease subunit, partial [Steroidobacteraceae bacterium]|nr:efflux RND transporter permease subunit [Steroidobacteraceae bacterium]